MRKMNTIRLQLLGNFSVTVDGRLVTEVLAHSPKGVQLMQYLILNRGHMETTAALTRAMWPENDATRPESALKTLISRLRGLMQQISPALCNCLKTVRGGYQWETQPGVWVDAEEFLTLANQLHGRIDLEVENQGTSFRRMMEVYTGRLLYGQEQPEWMQQRADALHQLYLNVVGECLQKLQNAGRIQEVVAICREALDADPLNEALNMRLMDGLMNTGRESEAIRQYQYVSDMISASGTSRSALDAYYQQMLQSGQDLQRSLENLRDELTRGNDVPGALICDRTIFGELFHLAKRSLERTDVQIVLGVAMICGLDHSPWQLNMAVSGLMEIMVRKLRRGDIITRLNATQVAILLSHATPEDAGAITDRLKRSFYLQFPAQGTLTFAFTPITLADESYVRHDEA